VSEQEKKESQQRGTQFRPAVVSKYLTYLSVLFPSRYPFYTVPRTDLNSRFCLDLFDRERRPRCQLPLVLSTQLHSKKNPSLDLIKLSDSNPQTGSHDKPDRSIVKEPSPSSRFLGEAARFHFYQGLGSRGLSQHFHRDLTLLQPSRPSRYTVFGTLRGLLRAVVSPGLTTVMLPHHTSTMRRTFDACALWPLATPGHPGCACSFQTASYGVKKRREKPSIL
jgi:hypothetical protein